MNSLFSSDWRTVWRKEVFCTLVELAACTGMRLGELLDHRGEFVFDGHLCVAGQHTKFGYGETKTRKERIIPLNAKLVADLNRLKAANGDGYLFSLTGGKTPVRKMRVYQECFLALTSLLMADIPDSKVMPILGHLSPHSKEHYTHFDTKKFTEVVAVQDKLLQSGTKKDVRSKTKVKPKNKKKRFL